MPSPASRIFLGMGGPASADRGDELVGHVVRNRRLGVVVPVLDAGLDGVHQVVHAGERSPSQTSVGEFFEPSLDEVKLARRRRDKVQVPACPIGMRQLLGDLGSVARRQVVQSCVGVEVLVDEVADLQDVRGGLAGPVVGQHLTGGEVQRREQVGYAVALVVVGHDAGRSRSDEWRGCVRSRAGTGPFRRR